MEPERNRVSQCILWTILAIAALAPTATAQLTLSPPRPLNTDAASDSGNDAFPRIVAEGPGRWLALWPSDDELDGTLGTDLEILYTTIMITPESHTSAAWRDYP